VSLLLGAALGAVLGASFLWLGVVICARHGLRLERRAPVVVAASACGAGIMHVLAGVPDLTRPSAALLFAAHGSLAAIVLVLAAIDAEHFILPNELTLGGAALALATSYVRAGGVVASFAGAATGLAAALLPWLLYRTIRKASGMGLGDAKLMLLAGAWHGPLGALFILFAAAVQSVVTALVLAAVGRAPAVPARARAEAEEDRALDPLAAKRDGFLGTALPFGPFLALGCIELLFLRRPILGAIERWLAH